MLSFLGGSDGDWSPGFGRGFGRDNFGGGAGGGYGTLQNTLSYSCPPTQYKRKKPLLKSHIGNCGFCLVFVCKTFCLTWNN